MNEVNEELIKSVMNALRNKYLATVYGGDAHWRDMALAAIAAVEKHNEETK